MVKVVFRKLEEPTYGGSSVPPNVSEKRIVGDDGKARTLRTLKAESGSFGSDLRYVFAKNVASARRENKRIAGVSDVAPAKG